MLTYHCEDQININFSWSVRCFDMTVTILFLADQYPFSCHFANILCQSPNSHIDHVNRESLLSYKRCRLPSSNSIGYFDLIDEMFQSTKSNISGEESKTDSFQSSSGTRQERNEGPNLFKHLIECAFICTTMKKWVEKMLIYYTSSQTNLLIESITLVFFPLDASVIQ